MAQNERKNYKPADISEAENKAKSRVLAFLQNNIMIVLALAIGAYAMIFLGIMFFDTVLEIAKDAYFLFNRLVKFSEQNPIPAIIGAVILILILRKLLDVRKSGFFNKPYFPTLVFVLIILAVQALAAFLIFRSTR